MNEILVCIYNLYPILPPLCNLHYAVAARWTTQMYHKQNASACRRLTETLLIAGTPERFLYVCLITSAIQADKANQWPLDFKKPLARDYAGIQRMIWFMCTRNYLLLHPFASTSVIKIETHRATIARHVCSYHIKLCTIIIF